MLKRATHRGECAVCGYRAALLKDGTVYRHYGGILPPEDLLPGGICRGWGLKPVPGSETEIEGNNVRRICWPVFDKVCLEGGCIYCQDNPRRAVGQISKRASELGL